MSDQTVVVDDSGSKQNVAYKLWLGLQHALPDDGDWKTRINLSLDLYMTCFEATNYGRKTKL